MKEINGIEIDLGLEMALTASVYRSAGQKALKALGQLDITKEQFGILVLLSHHNGLYQTQICNILGKDRPNITRMIDILETKKFIQRTKDETNRRIQKVYLTDLGYKKIADAEPFKHKMNHAQYKNLSDEEILTLINLLRKVRNSITEEMNIQE